MVSGNTCVVRWYWKRTGANIKGSGRLTEMPLLKLKCDRGDWWVNGNSVWYILKFKVIRISIIMHKSNVMRSLNATVGLNIVRAILVWYIYILLVGYKLKIRLSDRKVVNLYRLALKNMQWQCNGNTNFLGRIFFRKDVISESVMPLVSSLVSTEKARSESIHWPFTVSVAGHARVTVIQDRGYTNWN